MSSLGRAWTRFWFADGPTEAIGLFRIWFALVMFFEVHTSLALQRNALEGGFHLSYGIVPPLSEPLYATLHYLQYPGWVLLGLGVFPRAACAALLVLQAWPFFADHLVFRNHTYLAMLVTGLLAFSPCGRSFALLGGRAGGVAPVTAQRLIQFQIAAMYFWSAINKLTESFLSGSVMAYAIGESFLSRGLSGAVLDRLEPSTAEAIVAWASTPAVMAPAAWATVVIEFSLAFALWWQRTRLPAILLGIGFHVIIGVSMDIGTFGAIAVGTYLLFLDPERETPWLTRRSAPISTRESSPSPSTGPSG